jgi:hypothetical protein
MPTASRALNSLIFIKIEVKSRYQAGAPVFTKSHSLIQVCLQQFVPFQLPLSPFNFCVYLTIFLCTLNHTFPLIPLLISIKKSL